LDFKEYDSPENSNYYNDFELDEFEEADDNESEDGTWDEDGLDFDLNINFDLRMSENVDQPVPVVTAFLLYQMKLIENLLYVSQLYPLSATRRFEIFSISSLREPEFCEPELCEPEFCELFGY
jgi:hypothetical protein